jgi:16S rRNA (guanine966-N2)-methyltransferase
VRIIAGVYRGRRLRAPAGLATRPMLDRVREAMFGTLTRWIDDARVLDLFAGSGSLGLEALSRGARAARLVEKNPATLKLLRENVSALGLDERAETACADALLPRSWQGGALFDHRALYDVIFFDPPYAMLEDAQSRSTVLDVLATLGRVHLASPGYLVLHAPRRLLREDELPSGLDVALRQYGSTALWYVSRAGDDSER